MNQILKEKVYAQGNQRWVDYVEILTGMNNLERDFFQRMHEQQTDTQIMIDMGITSQKTFDKIEESVGRKLLWAILYCVDFTMKND